MTPFFTTRHPPTHLRRQSGVTLIILMILLVLGAVTLFVHTANSNALRIEQDKKTDIALAQAKEALIGYATTYRETHSNQVFGYLLCPDDGSISSEGSATGSCGMTDASAIGRLPWRTLGIPPLRDGHGECLWYSVSGTFKYNPKTDLMNWDTNGLIKVYAPDGITLLAGNIPPEQAVAVIFSPGQVINGQNRTLNDPNSACSKNYTASNYLDSASGIINSAVNKVANAISSTISAPYSTLSGSNVTINDKLVFITPNDLFAKHITKRTDFSNYLSSTTVPTSLIYQAATCLASPLPWAVPMTLLDYGKNTLYKAGGSTSTYAGRVPYTTMSSCGVDNEWWDNWKDNLFYAVSKSFAPGGSKTCVAASDCMTVNGQPYAAVVIFSGKKLGTQVRDVNTDKGNPANYLEGDNLITFNANNGLGSITKLNLPTNLFNDTVICINKNFQVVPNCDNP